MPLTDDEWKAFINLYNGAMDDVEADLHLSLEGHRLALARLVDRGEVSLLKADGLLGAVREPLFKVQDRLNAFGRELLQLREMGEL